jgi:acyl-homoserine-lactone acylase
MLLRLLAALTLFLPAAGLAQQGDMARWQRQAQRVTIVRDDWGIAHVRGRTDPDAVFGMIYAQAEDDFNRVETNYLTALGRTAEAEGEKAIFQDLRQRLFLDEAELRAGYRSSPAWLKRLMESWADGLNYYLATHPDVRPKVIRHFEPWMALSFTEGSIGGDIERVSLAGLEAFYGQRTRTASAAQGWEEPRGSNGFAIAPANSAGGKALLLINPHTSFFFRSELQMASDEGLNAYGAVTWGQFFIYQGFNQRAGWMHTSSGVDVVDEFLETIVRRGDRLFYRYGAQERPVTTSAVTIAYRTAAGGAASRTFTVYKTHHGPIVRAEGDKWVSIALMNKPVEALSQSYLRTKATDYSSFLKVADRFRANSSNNTIFADSKGEIAYMHPHFIPRRDDRFDYTKPVDGSDPATDWKGLHALSEAPHLLDPANGWIMNTNNWPYSAAGPGNSPDPAAYPRYMDTFGENPRGIHALRVLTGKRDFTLPSLIAAAYDPYLPAFAQLVPALVAAYDGTAPSNPLKAGLAGPVALLRNWDYRWGAASMPTSLAVFWGETLWNQVDPRIRGERRPDIDYLEKNTTAEQKLRALAAAVERLERDFGSWGVAWGDINRFQRLTGDIVQPFDDRRPSIPVPFTSSAWGSLASFGAKPANGSKRYYGTNGNSFVAVVEFGDKVRARAVSAGGESGNPASPHFSDQAELYALGNLREVYFYPEQLKGHTERSYHPGQ